MEEQMQPSRLTWRRFPDGRPVKRLADLQAALGDLMVAVDDDARSLDACSEHAHTLVTEICRRVRNDVFSPGGPLDPCLYKQTYDAFIATRDSENDMHEVYANDLECYWRRAIKGLDVAESDSDRLVLVKRRREYILMLLAFHGQVKAILEYLVEPRSAS
jgi:hypothetical protein